MALSQVNMTRFSNLVPLSVMFIERPVVVDFLHVQPEGTAVHIETQVLPYDEGDQSVTSVTSSPHTIVNHLTIAIFACNLDAPTFFASDVVGPAAYGEGFCKRIVFHLVLQGLQ
jgi:hypothetical protein